MVTKFDSLYLYASLANAKQEMNVLMYYLYTTEEAIVVKFSGSYCYSKIMKRLLLKVSSRFRGEVRRTLDQLLANFGKHFFWQTAKKK